MARLEEETYYQFKACLEKLSPRPYSSPLFPVIAAQWADWKRGISPTRKPKGRGGQNPLLLECFDALDRAEARAHANARPPQ